MRVSLKIPSQGRTRAETRELRRLASDVYFYLLGAIDRQDRRLLPDEVLHQVVTDTADWTGADVDSRPAFPMEKMVSAAVEEVRSRFADRRFGSMDGGSRQR